MSIERSRDRARTSGPAARNPRPDGISRRVASAARERQFGPLPEQVPTGWHLQVFDNPARPSTIARPENPDADSAAVDRFGPGGERPRRQVGRVLQDPATRRRRRPVLVVVGLAVALAAAAVAVLIISIGSRSPAEPATPAPAVSKSQETTSAKSPAAPTSPLKPTIPPTSAPSAPAAR